jgi:hypothetical protein
MAAIAMPVLTDAVHLYALLAVFILVIAFGATLRGHMMVVSGWAAWVGSQLYGIATGAWYDEGVIIALFIALLGLPLLEVAWRLGRGFRRVCNRAP